MLCIVYYVCASVLSREYDPAPTPPHPNTNPALHPPLTRLPRLRGNRFRRGWAIYTYTQKT